MEHRPTTPPCWTTRPRCSTRSWPCWPGELKRALQDDQNQLLDRLRRPGALAPRTCCPEDEQRMAYVRRGRDLAGRGLRRPGSPFARRSRRPGRRHAADRAGRPARAAEPGEHRGRPAPAPPRPGTTGPPRTGRRRGRDRVGAAYREWRGERIERLVGDHALAAFSAGVLAGAGASRAALGPGGGAPGLRRLRRQRPGRRGGARASEFPTGHRHPPAHAGCRCLVVPTPA